MIRPPTIGTSTAHAPERDCRAGDTSVRREAVVVGEIGDRADQPDQRIGDERLDRADDHGHRPRA